MDPRTVLKNLGELLKDRLTVSTVFGEPIKLESRTVIPVARVMVAGGGGYGKDIKKGAYGTKAHTAEEPIEDSGFGGGGMIKVQPIGFIYERDGEVVYSRIQDGRDPTDALPMVMSLISRLRGGRKK